jgi:hypothetical protein
MVLVFAEADEDLGKRFPPVLKPVCDAYWQTVPVLIRHFRFVALYSARSPVDRLRAILDNSIVRPTPEPLFVDRERLRHRVKEADRVNRIFVGAPLRMRDFDEAIHVCILLPALRRRLPIVEQVERRIYLIRGNKVMLDADLAELYQVPTKSLKRWRRASGRGSRD